MNFLLLTFRYYWNFLNLKAYILENKIFDEYKFVYSSSKKPSHEADDFGNYRRNHEKK